MIVAQHEGVAACDSPAGGAASHPARVWACACAHKSRGVKNASTIDARAPIQFLCARALVFDRSILTPSSC